MGEANTGGVSFFPVSTAEDLFSLDQDEILQGYRDYRIGDPEPGLNRGRAYWHGWMNRARDAGQRPQTEHARRLCRELLNDPRFRISVVTEALP